MGKSRAPDPYVNCPYDCKVGAVSTKFRRCEGLAGVWGGASVFKGTKSISLGMSGQGGACVRRMRRVYTGALRAISQGTLALLTLLGPPNHRHATHLAGQSCNFSSFCRIKNLSTQCKSARREIFSGPG